MPDWIDRPEQLAERLQHPPASVGLDTEFVRERTYWPQLALVQIAINDAIVLVDPLVPGMDAVLRELLENTSVLKIMHSASEDLVAFRHACGATPQPLFDTQIAAALAGVGTGMGYQKLVQELEDVALPKGETRSDWLRRPLSDAQLAYAADDVRHLHALHEALRQRLQPERAQWVIDDSTRLSRAAEADQGERWPHLAMRATQFLDAPAQARLLRLLRWRDAQARSSDRPRTWVLDNELALQLARQPPADAAALDTVLKRTPKAPRKLTEPLWRALVTPLPDESGMPLARTTDQDRKRLRAMQQAVTSLAERLALPEGVLASRRWLEHLLLMPDTWPEGLEGWRRPLLEPLLMPLTASGSVQSAHV